MDPIKFQRAQQHHQAGELVQAAQLYREILAAEPGQAEAHHLLGVLLSTQAAHGEAVAHLRQAVALNGGEATYHNNLGEALRRAGDVSAAAASYAQALRLRPGFAEAHYNLANVYMVQGQVQAALRHYQHAVQLRPGYARAQHNLGNALVLAGQVQAALNAYAEAVRLQPGQAEWRYNFAQALRRVGAWKQAQAELEQAVQRRPEYVEARTALAEVCRDHGQVLEALQHFLQVARHKPEDAGLQFQLGFLFSEQGRLEEAAKHYEAAVRLQPEWAEARSNLGSVVQGLGRPTEALAHFRAASALNPNLANIYRNLGLAEKLRGNMVATRAAYRETLRLEPENSLLRLETETIAPFILRSTDEIAQYRAELDATLDRFLAEPFPIDLTQLHIGEACPPYVLVYQGLNDRALKQKWARLFAGRLPQGEARPGTERPHIGFVVTHMHEGIFARSMQGILQNLPPERFQVTIVCNRVAVAHFLRAAMPSAHLRYLVIPARLDLALEPLRAARFDYLYYWEIGTDATNYFLPFFRLAPVQSTSWGWQVTSGIPTVDHYVSSQLLEGPGATEHYSEELILLNTLLTHYARPAVPAGGAREAYPVYQSDQHVYFCAQSLLKIHPDFDALAAEILRRDARGELVFVGLDDAYAGEQVQARWAQTMPDVLARVHLVPRRAEAEFVRLLAGADVVLDTRHYGGVNTTYQALAAGTPIVTWPGEFQRGRYTLGAYTRMGLADGVADSAEGYVERALALGTDRAYRETVSAQIRAASPVLYDDVQAARELADYLEASVAQARARGGGARVAMEQVRPRCIAFLDPSSLDYAADTPYQQALGGTQSAVCYLAEQLVERGVTVYLFTRNTRPRVVRGVQCLAWQDEIEALSGLIGWLQVEVAVTINAPLDPRLVAAMPGVRMILWAHLVTEQAALRELAQPAYREAIDDVVFVSAWQRAEYQARYGAGRARQVVLSNAVGPAFLDLFDAHEAILAAKPAPLLAYASAPYRGLELLLDVFPAIRAAVPEVRLQIFSSMQMYQGDDSEAQYAPLYARARSMAGVEYVGGVPQAQLAQALKKVSVLAYPNTQPETFCITVLEALAAGCQVVASALGALPETTAGMARLVSWEQGADAYRAAFVAAVVEALQEMARPEHEAVVRAQVERVNGAHRWAMRAEQWLAWLAQGVGAEVVVGAAVAEATPAEIPHPPAPALTPGLSPTVQTLGTLLTAGGQATRGQAAHGGRGGVRRIAFLDPSTLDYGVDTPYEQALGGTQSAVCYLAEQMAAQGMAVCLFTRNTRPRVARGVQCLAWQDDLDALSGRLRELQIEVLVGANAPIFPRLAAALPGVRKLLWAHHADNQPGVSDLAHPAFRAALDGCAFVSAWQRAQYIARFGLDAARCVVMPNAISPAFVGLFAADEAIMAVKPAPALVYASAPYRGLDLLLELFPAIRAAVPEARLRIFSSMQAYQGQALEAQYEPLYAQARGMAGVEYVGSVPQRQLADELKRATVLAYPNTFPETFCITALEAMAAGCQVVSSDLGALPETTAGYARLVSWGQGPSGAAAYRRAFVEAVVAGLRAAQKEGGALEARLREQVAWVNREARWERRAEAWRAWLEGEAGEGRG